jgi:ABC-type bacteriocin/lantibiotic exporter with double-glycine peptidase domain
MKHIDKLTDAFKKNILTTSERLRLTKLMVLGLAASLSDILVIGLVYPLISLLSSANRPVSSNFPNNFLNITTNKQQLIFSCLVLLFAYVLRMIVFLFYKRGVARLRRDINTRISSSVFDNYLCKNLEFYSSSNSSEIIRNISAIDGYVGVHIFGVVTLVSELMLGIGLIGLVTIMSPGSTFPALIFCGILGYFAHRITKSKLKFAGEKSIHAVSGRLRIIQEGLGGISEIKLYSKEEFFKEEFDVHQVRAADADCEFEVYSNLTAPLFELVLISTLMLFTALFVSTQTDFAPILPTLALFAGAAFRIIPSFGRVINYMQNLDFSSALANELRAIVFAGKEEIGQQPNYLTKYLSISKEASLRLIDVSFSYESKTQPVLSNINMQFEQGKTYSITGESGSGKSTLVALILGLFKPKEGGVYVGGVSISESMKSWQESIGYVPQSIFLRDESIRKNITLGELTDNQALLDQVIIQSGLQTFVSNQSHGVDTKIGESGSRISGGERQRIGIARALYRNPSLLVFDEATNALDQETEEKILDTIFSMRGQLTIIFLSHNDKVVERCDVIYKLKN